jgi:hypothetical protein
MEIMDEEAGEILVVRNESNACIEVHIRGISPDEYRIVRLARHEARRLSALILYQAERLGRSRPGIAAGSGAGELKTA